MTDLVDATAAMWRRGGHVWGQSDCLLSIGDYIAAAGGKDVTGLFRGTYDDEAGAMAYVERYGGHGALIDLTGAARTETPGRGDVAVIDTGYNEIGALCTGDGYILRLERGVIEINARFVDVLIAWKVSNDG